MIKKTLINLLIILLWVAFGIGYFWLFMAGREAQNQGQQGGESASETAEIERITATLAENSRPLNPDALCLSTTILTEPAWTNPEFQTAVNALNISTLRLPGGAAAGFWDWQTGRLAAFGEGEEFREGNNTLDSYLAGLEGTDTKPILTLNMVTSNLSDQLSLIDGFKVGGVPVTAVELGYKAYLGQPGPSGELTFPTVSDYVAEAGRWAGEIQAQFPEVAIALIAAPPTFEGYQEWNSAVYNLASEQNLAVTFYPFPESPLEAGQPLNEMTVAAVLGAPYKSWQDYTDGESAVLTDLPSDVPIWLTEYNIWSEHTDEPEVSGTWAESLFVVGQSLLFLGEERVEFICPHPLMGRLRSAAYLEQNEGYQLQATGRAVQLLGQSMNGMNSARQIEFNNVPVQERVDYPVLMGWVFGGEGGQRTAVMINLGGTEAEVNIDSLPADFPNRYQQIIGNPLRRIRGRDGFEVLNGSLIDRERDNSRKRFIILPRYSIMTFSSVE